MKEIFTKIYDKNFWKNTESRSGPGSTVLYTENLRKELKNLFVSFNIKTVLDAPCGDFNWMKLVLLETEIDYIGGDIVPSLIENNISLYKKENINFKVIDITTDKLPSADLMICRDCLFHLSVSDIQKFFKNFVNSDINYLLTTTHYNDNTFKNNDIESGGFRKLDLFSEPFNLDKNVHYKIDDWIEGFHPRFMVLFSKDQIKNYTKDC